MEACSTEYYYMKYALVQLVLADITDTKLMQTQTEKYSRSKSFIELV